MILNGRYTLSGGMVKYAMPIIPLKEFFTIQDGSYVQWSGNPMDPMLNLTATERMRASVTQDDGSSRLVTFNVGCGESNRRRRTMQLQFILSAPEDQSMQQELDKMGEGQRSQIAVTMLVTGDVPQHERCRRRRRKKPSLDMGAALNSFLQSEINNIAGSALKSVDITLGMEQYDQNGTGIGRGADRLLLPLRQAVLQRPDQYHTGRTCFRTGQDVNAGQSQQFIDNVSIEYRLDGSGTATSSSSTTRTTRVCWKARSQKPVPVSSCAKRCFTSVNSSSLKKNKPKPVTDDKQTEEKK